MVRTRGARRLRQGTEVRKLAASPVGVRFDPDTRARVAAAAVAAGLTDAAWLRAVAVAAAGLTGDEARAAAAPTAPAEPAAAPVAADTAAVAELGYRVSQLNGAVVQLAAAVREQGAARLHAEVEEVLEGLRAARAEVGAVARAGGARDRRRRRAQC